MWQTFLIWRVMNAPLPIFNPFRRLLKLQLPTQAPRTHPLIERVLSWLPAQLVSCLVGLGLVILLVWSSLVCIVLVTPFVFVLFGSLPTVMFAFCVSLGGFLAIRISNKLSRIRTSGIYDLISVSSYGDQQAIWLMGRAIYKDMLWLKDTRIMMSNSMIITTLLLILMSALGVVSSLTTPAASAINLLFLETVTGLVFLTIAVYLSLVHALVIGYLIALWSIGLSTDNLTRSVATVAGFIGVHLIVYISAYSLLTLGLPAFYRHMRWTTFLTLGTTQVLGLVVIYDLSVRVLLRLLAQQVDLPYRQWRAELEL
ncbi:MAG: hypothetical protein CUN52_12045 [Phototrophicales bacterium]|nr:MAG: hypothetical protein CUN52_12045 [Phototrophicales bacterium]